MTMAWPEACSPFARFAALASGASAGPRLAPCAAARITTGRPAPAAGGGVRHAGADEEEEEDDEDEDDEDDEDDEEDDEEDNGGARESLPKAPPEDLCAGAGAAGRISRSSILACACVRARVSGARQSASTRKPRR